MTKQNKYKDEKDKYNLYYCALTNLMCYAVCCRQLFEASQLLESKSSRDEMIESWIFQTGFPNFTSVSRRLKMFQEEKPSSAKHTHVSQTLLRSQFKCGNCSYH